MKRIAVLAGGYSGEIEVSMKSAITVFEHLKKGEFNPYLVIITKDRWYVEHDGQEININHTDFSFMLDDEKINFDFAYIIIHGTPGEDGKLQGYFDMLQLPYSTGSVWNTALTFNKISTKQALDEMGYYTANYVHFLKDYEYDKESIINKLGLPLFVKPAESGSSLGISKAKSTEDLENAIHEALKYHHQVLIEEFIPGREITCGVWRNNGNIEALPITEVITQKDFFDYSAKYELDQTVEITPADIPEEDYKKCQEITIEIYRDLDCDGIVRIDYILSEKGLMVIEINTVPGMTSTSFIPQQAEEAKINLTHFFESSITNKLK